MTHEAECYASNGAKLCICDRLRIAYRRGYNDHARSAQHWRDTHGAYQQHGPGENP